MHESGTNIAEPTEEFADDREASASEEPFNTDDQGACNIADDGSKAVADDGSFDQVPFDPLEWGLPSLKRYNIPGKEGLRLIVVILFSIAIHATIVALCYIFVSSRLTSPHGSDLRRADAFSDQGFVNTNSQAVNESPQLPQMPLPVISNEVSASSLLNTEPTLRDAESRNFPLPEPRNTSHLLPDESPDPPPLFGLASSTELTLCLPNFKHRLPPGKVETATTAPSSLGDVAGTGPNQNGSHPASAAVAHVTTVPRAGHRAGVDPRGVGNGLDDRRIPIPDYPSESKRRHEEGVVTLNLEVRPDGTVANVTVEDSAGFPRLATAAIAAARVGRFEPATIDGKPTTGHLIVPFRFTLQ